MDISLIVPFKNEERFIEQCIQSILSQDYDATKYEILFVDNGSTDASAAIVNRFPRIKLLTETEGKVYTARNRALKAASGKAIAFTDADCLLGKDWLATVYDSIVIQKSSFVLGPTFFPSPKSTLLQMVETYRNDHIQFIIENMVKSHLYGYTNNMGVRAEIFQEYGPFLELPVPGDTEIIHRVLKHDPGVRIEFRHEMQIEHLELLRFWILLKKLYHYGYYDSHLEHPDYGDQPLGKPSGAETHCVKKNKFDLRQRVLFRIVTWLCNTCFWAGQQKGRLLRRFGRG